MPQTPTSATKCMRICCMCFYSAFFVALCALPPSFAADAGTIEIVLVGDTGFNAAGAQVTANGGFKNGRLLTVSDAISGIAGDRPWIFHSRGWVRALVQCRQP